MSLLTPRSQFMCALTYWIHYWLSVFVCFCRNEGAFFHRSVHSLRILLRHLEKDPLSYKRKSINLRKNEFVLSVQHFTSFQITVYLHFVRPHSASSLTHTHTLRQRPHRGSCRLGTELVWPCAPPALCVSVRWRGRKQRVAAAVDCNVRAQQPRREPVRRSQILRGLRGGWERRPGRLRQHEDRHGAVRRRPGGWLGTNGVSPPLLILKC